MTTTQLQLRRDTTANIDGITPAQGEPIYDVTRKALVLGDGATIGGNCVTPFGGTWTPGLQGTVANPTVTYSSQVGVWFQIGALVVAQGTIVISSLSGGSGSLQIDGLPVTAIAASVGSAGAGVIATLAGFTFHSSSYTQVGLFIMPNSTLIEFEETGSGQPSFQSAVGQAGSSFSISFTAIYLAAQPTG